MREMQGNVMVVSCLAGSPCGLGSKGLSEITFTLLDHLAGQNIHILPTNPLRVENLLSRREKLYCTTLP